MIALQAQTKKNWQAQTGRRKDFRKMWAHELRRNAAFQTQIIKKKVAQLTLTANSKATISPSWAVTTFGWIRGITGEAVPVPKSFQGNEMS